MSLTVSPMPCRVESNGCGPTWYCCNCHDGPHYSHIIQTCTSCNNHELCPNPVTSAQTQLPRQTQQTHTASKRCRQDIRVATHVQLNKQSSSDASSNVNGEAQCVPGGGDVITISGRVHKAVESGSAPAHHPLDHLSVAVKDRAPAFETRPSGSSATRRGHNRTAPRPQAAPRRGIQSKARRTSSGVTNRPPSSDHSEDDENTGRRPKATKRSAPSTPSTRTYACPYYKFNPHYYRHEKTCSQGYTHLCRLREHLTRPRSPHRPQKCNIGFLPVGPRADNSISDDEALWGKWYLDLFPDQIHVPSCYYEDEDIIRSNDPANMGYFRQQFISMIENFPPEQHAKPLRNHLLGLLESELYLLRELLKGREPEILSRQAKDLFPNTPGQRKARHQTPDPLDLSIIVADHTNDELPDPYTYDNSSQSGSMDGTSEIASPDVLETAYLDQDITLGNQATQLNVGQYAGSMPGPGTMGSCDAMGMLANPFQTQLRPGSRLVSTIPQLPTMATRDDSLAAINPERSSILPQNARLIDDEDMEKIHSSEQIRSSDQVVAAGQCMMLLDSQHNHHMPWSYPEDVLDPQFTPFSLETPPGGLLQPLDGLVNSLRDPDCSIDDFDSTLTEIVQESLASSMAGKPSNIL